jgi:hypothetical protein
VLRADATNATLAEMKEKAMMKKSVILLLFLAIMLAVTSLAQGGHPGTISCPIDGTPMVFDHLVVGSNQTGSGQHNVCWYKHTVLYNGERQTHTGYIPCEN